VEVEASNQDGIRILDGAGLVMMVEKQASPATAS